MNEIRKEKLRIANICMAIMEKEVAFMSVDFSNYGTGTDITEWLVDGENIEIKRKWSVYSSEEARQLKEHKEIRLQLEELYREALAQREEVAA